MRCEVGFQGNLRIRRPGTASSAHWHAAHAFNTAANRHVGLAGHNLRCSHVAGFEPRGAETIDLHASRGFGIVGVQYGDPGNVSTLLTDRRNASKDNIIDIFGVEIIAVTDRFQRLGRQLERGNLVQAA